MQLRKEEQWWKGKPEKNWREEKIESHSDSRKKKETRRDSSSSLPSRWVREAGELPRGTGAAAAQHRPDA